VDSIVVIAQVARVQTLADGGIRWTFDVPETAVLQSANLMECKRLGAVVKMELIPTMPEDAKEEMEYGGRLK
jgi:hypothetical protein